MSVLQSLIETDKRVFLELNSVHSPFWDVFFWIFTQIITWIPLYLTIIYVVIKSQNKGSVVTILAFVVLIVLSDQISNNLIKNTIERLRPSHEPSLSGLVYNFNNYRGGRFSFVSSHAANSFALALFVALLFRNLWLSASIFIWAILNSYSRIYLGVHYPGDIIGGALTGMLIAAGVYLLYLRVYPLFVYMPHNTKFALRKQMAGQFKPYHAKILTYAIGFSFIILLIVSKIILKIQ